MPSILISNFVTCNVRASNIETVREKIKFNIVKQQILIRSVSIVKMNDILIENVLRTIQFRSRNLFNLILNNKLIPTWSFRNEIQNNKIHGTLPRRKSSRSRISSTFFSPFHNVSSVRRSWRSVPINYLLRCF